MLNRIRSLALIAFFSALSACAATPSPVPVSDTLGRQPQLSTFNRLVEQAGLQDELRAAGPFTVFAPSDDAFKAVPAKTLDAWNADKEQLKAVLRFHVVEARLASAAVVQGNQKSVQGAPLALSRAGEFVTVEDAMVQQADINASNGVVHVIDRVLVPPKK